MKKKSFFLLSTALLLCLQLLPAVNISGQGELLPVPREETLYIRFHPDYFIFDDFNFYKAYTLLETGILYIAHEALYYYNITSGEVIKWLSTGWDYSEDYKTLTIYIREGVTWSDGEPFTSEDVVFTLNMRKYNYTMYEDVLDVEAPDPYTVVITLDRTLPRFHEIFMCKAFFPELTVVPKHVWEKAENFTTFTNYPPVTTGPYKFKQAIPDLKMFVWERREDYWGKELGYFPEPKYVVYQTRGDSATEYELLKIDAADFSPIGYDLAVDLEKENPEIEILQIEYDICPNMLYINCLKYPLNYTEVRWAIAHCIDYEKWTRLLRPLGFVARYPHTGQPGFAFEDILGKYKLQYDTEKAKALLDGLGFTLGDDGIYVTPNGTRLSFEYLSLTGPGGFAYEVGVDLLNEAKKAGIEITVKPLPFMTIYGMVLAGQFQMATGPLCTTATTEPLQVWELYRTYTYGSGGLIWWQGNQTFDDLVGQIAAMNPGDPEILTLYKRVLEIWMENLPDIPTVGARNIVGPVSTHYWTGWPTPDNLYNMPAIHVGHFIFTLFRLKSWETVMRGGLMDLYPYMRTGPEKELVKSIAGVADQLTQAIEDLEASIERLEGAVATASTYTNASIAVAVIALIISAVAVMRPKRA